MASSVLPVLFASPAGAFKFWAGQRILKLSLDLSNAHLVKDEPESGVWTYQLDWDGGLFVGERLPPFLPTRANITAMNAGSRHAAEILKTMVAAGSSDGIDFPENLFPGVDPDGEGLSFSLRDPEYCARLETVLKDDWGVSILLKRSAMGDDVVLDYREGLPCAAAMERAVLVLIQVLMGSSTCRVESQRLVHEGGRTYDVLSIRFDSDEMLAQRFDISSIFGKPLPNRYLTW